ncbi:hypothetical protein [Amycolatopsis vancoresmycina]|uniref:Uncharacterized protein n=1 Tax=Amycolatopsis vancoresmycina DSM 44592 TaxID=1292037 RepID=R1G3K7_9PSEU|nr:hypothetical protein [Amycolatopsis vancoresmycina]EOD66022.1 hypothetical protein H480_23727 [Amycolatopsis vancoresmycina DSM 44592]
MTAAFPPDPKPRPLLTRPAFTGLAGLLTGALLVGVPWLVTSRSGAEPDGRPLAAPAALGELGRTEDAVAKIDNVRGQAQIARVGKADRETGARVSAAYGGAAAVVQEYRDDRLLRGLQLTAVRAASPELIATYEDPQALGVAKPGTELVRVGAVQCLVHNDPAAPGSAPDPELSFVTNCQRTGPGLTVAVRSLGADGNRDPAKIASLLDQAWDTLSR